MITPTTFLANRHVIHHSAAAKDAYTKGGYGLEYILATGDDNFHPLVSWTQCPCGSPRGGHPALRIWHLAWPDLDLEHDMGLPHRGQGQGQDYFHQARPGQCQGQVPGLSKLKVE